MKKKMLILMFKKSVTFFYIRNEKSNLRAFKTLDCVINIKLRIFFKCYRGYTCIIYN